MRLCVFDAGQGPRLGHVRGNHVVDLTGLDAAMPSQRAQIAAASSDVRAKLTAFACSCPHPGTLLRKETVRILDEWDEPRRRALTAASTENTANTGGCVLGVSCGLDAALWLS